MIAYHGQQAIKDRSVTERVIEGILTHESVQVDAVNGLAYSDRWHSGAVPLGCRNTKGYTVCTLYFNGERAQVKLHQLVWIAVNGSIPQGFVIDHRNRIKHDNRIENLRLASPVLNSENRRSYDGADNPSAKITASIANQIRERHVGAQSYAKVSREFGVSRSLVAQIVRGELWSVSAAPEAK